MTKTMRPILTNKKIQYMSDMIADVHLKVNRAMLTTLTLVNLFKFMVNNIHDLITGYPQDVRLKKNKKMLESKDLHILIPRKSFTNNNIYSFLIN